MVFCEEAVKAVAKVEVRLHATLRRYVPQAVIGEPVMVQVEEGTSLGDLFAQLHLPEHEVRIVFVNGLWEEEGYLLQEGDRVALFPPIGGGVVLVEGR